MRVAIFGAEDGMGRALTEQALAAGHAVNTHATIPGEYPIDWREHDHLHVVEGDAFDVRATEQVVKGADCVCSAIGVRSDHLPGVTLTEGTENILVAMDRFLVPRIVVATAAGVGESANRASLGGRLRNFFDRERFADLERLEALVRESDREWVIVRPPRITNDAGTDAYRVGPDVETGLRSTVSRADLATFMLAEANDATALGQAVTIAD